MDALTGGSGASLAAKIDQHVGEAIRRRRILLGLTQEQLAEALQISYQQIQKYETGANRISAGRLFQIAECLNTSVDLFFQTLSSQKSTHADYEVEGTSNVSSRSTIELVRNFNAIPDNNIRTSVSGLIKSLASAENSDAAQRADANAASDNSLGLPE